jgi:hypothetical protein
MEKLRLPLDFADSINLPAVARRRRRHRTCWQKTLREMAEVSCSCRPGHYTFENIRLSWCVMSMLPREKVMVSSVVEEVDLIQELRLRRWARENYVPEGQREASWHPVILDEMQKKDLETEEPLTLSTSA